MAAITELLKEQARAQQEAMELIERLLGEESPRLASAQHDVTGRTMPEFRTAMIVSELARAVAALQQRVEELEATAPKPKKGAQKKK